ncbi:hypothetical protein CCMSSC00406_0002918 [Pleurotus cornucopiae]|uniref:Uncharacterized protein n=1 Tax=Pleurotus cornucopiae TaxID=5321 RepID=A0ACB7J577_PLECO|nr:hypothetical protein CCMSSC00406_0002918 [Pleurotus cornucopiae]
MDDLVEFVDGGHHHAVNVDAAEKGKGNCRRWRNVQFEVGADLALMTSLDKPADVLVKEGPPESLKEASPDNEDTLMSERVVSSLDQIETATRMDVDLMLPVVILVPELAVTVEEVECLSDEVAHGGFMLHFWTDKIPVEATIAFVLVLYVAINFFAVKWYGESEFWLSLGKVILAASLIFFTFITMVGGNPLHDVYGFCNWDSSKVPGAPFAEYIETGSLGRFLGFLTCLIQAAFTMVGPDYISMTAGKAVNPRCVLPKVFNSVVYRLATFFMVGSLCVGIVILYNDSNLKLVISDARPGAGSSPYVIAMERLQIPVLPHLVNAMILLSVFSAGNTYVYCASRTLFGLALEGKMPRVLTRCTKSGVPVYAVMVTIGIALLSFLQVLNGTVKVLQWFVDLPSLFVVEVD